MSKKRNLKSFATKAVAIAIAGQNLAFSNSARAEETGDIYKSGAANMLDKAYPHYVEPGDILFTSFLLTVAGGAKFYLVRTEKEAAVLVKQIRDLDLQIADARTASAWLKSNSAMIEAHVKDPLKAAQAYLSSLTSELNGHKSTLSQLEGAMAQADGPLIVFRDRLTALGQGHLVDNMATRINGLRENIEAEITRLTPLVEEARTALSEGRVSRQITAEIEANLTKANQLDRLLSAQEDALNKLRRIPGVKIEHAKLSGNARPIVRNGALRNLLSVGSIAVLLDQTFGIVVMVAVQKNPGVSPTIKLIDNTSPEDFLHVFEVSK